MRKSTVAALAGVAIALTGAGVLTTTGSPIAAPAAPVDPTPTPATAPSTALAPQNNAAVEWNAALLDITGTPPAPGAAPSTIQPTRNFAILALAIDAAVNSIDHSHQPTTGEPAAAPDASAPAAAASAAHDALVALYPAHQAELDTRLANDLATLPGDNATQQGVLVGQAAAKMILDSRSHDGSDSPAPTFVADSTPGRYQPTPPASAPPVFTGWGKVMPFVLHSGDQFRPAPPPALDSQAYAAALAETQQLGAKASAGRTADQTQDATFWAGPIQNYWNAIAEQVAIDRGTDLDDSAYLFGQLDTTLADATIALYDAKYSYQLWRPITAIRHADADQNDGTTADVNWEPLSNTPADPSYPGAHSDLSFAAATVLTHQYGDSTHFTVTSSTLPGVNRTFSQFSDAAAAAGLSRIYAGVHTRVDHEAGRELGIQVADYVLTMAPGPAA